MANKQQMAQIYSTVVSQTDTIKKSVLINIINAYYINLENIQIYKEEN